MHRVPQHGVPQALPGFLRQGPTRRCTRHRANETRLQRVPGDFHRHVRYSPPCLHEKGGRRRRGERHSTHLVNMPHSHDLTTPHGRTHSRFLGAAPARGGGVPWRRGFDGQQHRRPQHSPRQHQAADAVGGDSRTPRGVPHNTQLWEGREKKRANEERRESDTTIKITTLRTRFH